MNRSIELRPRIGLAYAAFVFIGANDGGFGVLLPSIQNFYHVDKSTVSLLFVFGVSGYLISAFSSGLLVQKLGARRFLALGPAVFILGAGGLASAPPFLLALPSMMVASFGVGVIDAGLNSYIAGLPNNTGPLNNLHAFYGTGALIGPIVASGFLAAGLVWNAVYLVWAGAALVIMIGIWNYFRAEVRAPHTEVAHTGGNVLSRALREPVTWLAGIFLLLYVGGEVSMGNWSYSLLTEDRGLPPLFAGWTVSGFWFGLTIGRFILARIARRAGVDDKGLIQLCLGGVLVGLLLVWLPPKELGWPSTVAMVAGLWLTGFSQGPIFPTTIAVMSRLLPKRLLASAIGFVASGGSAGGALFPWIAGNLAQRFGLWTLMPYVIGISLLSLTFWLLLQSQPSAPAETVPQEVEVGRY